MHKILASIPLMLALSMLIAPIGGGGILNGCSTSIPDGLNPVSMQGCIQNSCQSLNETALPVIQPLRTQQGCQTSNWDPFPINETELYNINGQTILTSDRALVDFNGVQKFLLCIHNEAHYNLLSQTAFLRPEYSPDQGSTWFEMASTTTLGDIPMSTNDGITVCSGSGVTPVTLVSGIQSQIRTVRIVGFGGNGQEGYGWSFLYLLLYTTDQPVVSCGMTATSTTAATITCARTRTVSSGQGVTTFWSCTQNGILTQDGSRSITIAANTQSGSVSQAIGPGFTATPQCLADPAAASVLGAGVPYVVQTFYFTL
ncbi:hypothetical protein AUG19_02300 [archaeon 13_1_20CM_2_54_9]|nr:MAG: hypothetical protein AUJ07_03890 [Crenarchaeota archaeon 13_1_40CM_3_53_5]OLE76678.1 MAG: hypothetical protein AUG19_02300 [archaeon 13_1_20CM_2_54_9]